MYEFTPQVFDRKEALACSIHELEMKARSLLADLSYISELMWKCSKDYQTYRAAIAEFKRWEMMTSKRHPQPKALQSMMELNDVMRETEEGYIMHKRLSVTERTISQMVSLIQSILRTERDLAGH